MKNYKDTLLIPSTDFEMRGNLPNKEPLFFDKWNKLEITKKAINKSNKKTFVLHEGPPYANGNLHVGHALNKYLKDFIIRSKTMSDYKIHYKHGWDTHGLPIELAVQKKGNTLQNNSIDEYLQKCEDYALKQVSNQKEQMEKFQLFWPLDDHYLTLNKEYEYNQIKIFTKLAQDNLIYQDLKPVYWSWSVQSALAEAEVEYHDKTSISLFTKFEAKNEDYSLIIWTTTPWTLMGNVAIAVNKKFEYGFYETKEFGKVILATKLAEGLFEKWGLKTYQPIKKVIGSELEKKVFINPINGNESLLVLSNHVTLEGGTGLVHIAGGHGSDDFVVAKNNKLEVFSVVGPKGVMNQRAGEFDGQFYLKVEPLVIEKLSESKHIVFTEEIIHSYPHDWRTKKPLIFRATKQWFVNISKIEKDLLKEIDSINWTPEWGKIRMKNMMEGRQDWCISRQRLWGVPIPVIYDDQNNPIFDEKILLHIQSLIKKHGSKIWFQSELKDLVPKGTKIGKNWRKETDTMDVWFDSGISHTLLIPSVTDQIDLYLEGNDQYRGWFNTSLITSLAYNGKSAYKNILSHGFVLDKDGNKMSKSKGNIIDPLKIINQFGSDVLRMWVANSDYQKDVRIGDDIIKQTSDKYRKLRNTIKFMMANTNDFNLKKDAPDSLEEIDNYILTKLNNLVKDVINNYEKYEFNKIINDILNFYVVEFRIL